MIRLEVIAGAATGGSFELDRGVAHVGRAPGSEVTIDDPLVSARHARIAVGVHEAVLEDLGSTNGTAILRGGERRRLEPGDAVALMDEDVIELGSDDTVCRLLVRLREEDKSAHVVSVKHVDEAAPAVVSSLRDDPVTLRALYDAQSRIGRASDDLDVLLDTVAQAVFDLVPQATHVTVVLREGDAPMSSSSTRAVNYLPVLSRVRPADRGGPPSGSQSFVPVTRSVYRKVLEERAAVLAADAPKLLGATPSIMGAQVRSTIAVPLWRRDEILGVVQVDNRDAPGMLKARDLDVLLVIAEQASLAVANGRLIKRLVAAEQRLRQENAYLKDREKERRGDEARGLVIVGESEATRRLLAHLDKVVNTNVTVLIEGETGTGKELVAAALHYRSRRQGKLFVAQNCAALAESLLESELFGHRRGAFTGATEDKKGLFELADGGTLFLDEVTEAPASIQSKLLRALQEGEIRPVGAGESKLVDVRVVAATNRDLEAEVAAGRFRQDLYYRLKVFPLRVPPLRARRGDIPLLVQHFLARYAGEMGKAVAGVAPEAMSLLTAYDWPGNVRELQNELQRIVIQVDDGAFVTAELLSARVRGGGDLLAKAAVPRGSLKETMDAVEKYFILEVLREHKGNKTSAARALGITREGLHKKLRQLELGGDR
jgi:Nif-specific regulatory protein